MEEEEEAQSDANTYTIEDDDDDDDADDDDDTADAPPGPSSIQPPIIDVTAQKKAVRNKKNGTCAICPNQIKSKLEPYSQTFISLAYTNMSAYVKFSPIRKTSQIFVT